LEFNCTNNIAKYEALLLRLRKLRAMGIRRAVLKSDSQVITGHVGKNNKARDPKLEKYLDTVRRMEAYFEAFLVKNIPRGENEQADLLAKSAGQGLPLPSEVFNSQSTFGRAHGVSGAYNFTYAQQRLEN
jgi:ribonuclease HI